MEEKQNKSEKFYLQESLRLSELLLTEQNKTLTAIEKKAILLVTFNIAIIAYLLKIDDTSKIVFILYILPMISAFSGAFALSMISAEVPGANPAYLLQEQIKYDFERMAIDLLDDYEQRLKFNRKRIAINSNLFTISWLSGIGGFLYICIWWVIFHKLA